MAFDLILKGGYVVDGTGNPWFRADVGVAGAQISAVGDLLPPKRGPRST